MQFQPNPVFGLTRKWNGHTRVLTSDISISLPFDPATEPATERKNFNCIWDTGASGTVITLDVINALGLKPSGKIKTYTVGQGGNVNEYLADAYFVNVYLPNNVQIIGVNVSEGAIFGGDVLLGMDIIGMGDFAVTNHNGLTVMTYRIPSVETIDFVEEIRIHNQKYGRLQASSPILSDDERRKLKNKQKRKRRGRE